MSQIQSGVDPSARPDETGITLKEAVEHHLSEKTFRPATAESYRYHLEKYLSRLRGRAVADITRADVRDLYDTLRKQRGQTTASRVMRTLRAAINTAMRLDETIRGNPVGALRVPTPNRREVDALDLAAWWVETEKCGPIRRDLHRAMMLTRARRSSILQVRRDDVDVAKGIMTFRHMKTGGQMMFPMGKKLTAMIEARLEVDAPLNSTWLWPSATSSSGRIMEPKEQRRALPSPHEYRHHARTLFIAAGVPYAESALLLGQRLPGASGGYVHAEHLVEHLRPHAQALEGRVWQGSK
jgi:integrase